MSTSPIGQFVGILRALTGKELKTHARAAVRRLAQRAQQEVSAEYEMMANAAPQNTLGAKFALYGKAQGAVRPPRPPHAPGETYRRLSKAVAASALTHAGTAGGLLAQADVGIRRGGRTPDPTPNHPDGVPLELVDAGLNAPPSVVGYEESVRSVVYMIMIREGRGGFGKGGATGRHLPDAPDTNAGIILTSRGGKKVWEHAILSTIRRIAAGENAIAGVVWGTIMSGMMKVGK